MDLYQRVDEDILGVYKRWADGSKPYFERSRGEFSRLVNPRAYYDEAPDPNDIVLINLCFTEWFLFEFDLADGCTPLECYVAEPPTGIDEESVQRLAQVATTQRFSRFAICEKLLASEDARLLDLFTGEELLVHAPTVCKRRNWRRGTVSMRIACVDGRWMQTGKATLYDKAPAKAGCSILGEDKVTILARKDGAWGFLHREWSESYFLNLLYDVIGVAGAYTDTCRAVPV